MLLASWVVIWHVSTQLKYLFDVSPEMQVSVQQLNSDVMWLVPYMNAMVIIGIVIAGIGIAFVGYMLYKDRKMEMGAWIEERV